jgi:hypothetical protein
MRKKRKPQNVLSTINASFQRKIAKEGPLSIFELKIKN